MNFLKRKINLPKKNKTKLLLILAIVIIGLFLVFLPESSAKLGTETDASGQTWLKSSITDPWDFMVSIIGNLLILIITLVGRLLLLFMKLVAGLFQYNNFVHAYAVEIGWPLMRDVMNISFVIILLVVAFSTILKISRYHYKGILWKLIVMAILVNFSKTILGFIIDFTQVIMMTFVNGFKGAMAINLANSFGVGNLLQFDEGSVSQGDLDKSSLIMGLILALALMVVACFTMVVYMVVLLWRIISLWVAVILSPLAFVGQAFPGLQKHSADFWAKFWNILTVGVAMAFFMWLSLTILAMSGGVSDEFNVNEDASSSVAVGGNGQLQSDAVAVTKASNPENLFTYIVAIVLLLMGLQYAQQAGGFAGKFAGTALTNLGKLGSKAVKTPFKGAGLMAGNISDRIYAKSGIDLNMNRNIARFKSSMAKTKEQRLSDGGDKADKLVKEGNFLTSRMAAITGGNQDHFQNYGVTKGIGKLMGFGAMGKKAQIKSDKAADEAKKLDKDASGYRDIINAGGSNDYFIKTGGKRIQDDINTSQTRLNELSSKRRPLTEDEKTEQKALSVKITDLKEQEVGVELHLEASKIDFDADDENLDQQIVKFNESYNQVNNKKTEADKEITLLTRERKSTESDLSKSAIDKRAEIDAKIVEKKESLEKIKAEQSRLTGVRKIYGLDSYDGEKEVNPNKLKTIRDQAKLVRINDITPLAQNYNKQKTAEIKNRLKDKNLSPEERTKLENQNSVLKIEADVPAYLSEAQKEDYKERVIDELEREKDKKIKSAAAKRPVSGYEGKRARLRVENEEYEKIKHVENDEELCNMFKESQLVGHKTKMSAVLKKLANDGNFNEVLKFFNYDQDYQGNKDFFENELVKKGGFGEQEMLSLASDISFLNESKGLRNLSRTTAMENGTWKWNPEHVQAEIVTEQTKKMDPRSVVQRLNRLAFGGEDVNGNFSISLTGATELRQIARSLDNEKLVNEHMNANLISKLLEAEMRDQEFSRALIGMKTSDGRDLAPRLIKLFKQRMGTEDGRVETVEESIRILLSKKGSNL